MPISPHNASRACYVMLAHLVKDNMLVLYANCFDHLCQMACKMPFEPQHPTILHPWGCSCLAVIKGDFVPKGAEQLDHSSQDIDLEYKKYSILLIGK